MIATLTDEGLAEGIGVLCGSDDDLAGVIARFGPPPLWAREPGFPSLVQIIFEQQVSLASGRAAFARLAAAAGAVTPERIAALEAPALTAAGLTRQKTAYVLALARAIVGGEVDLDGLAARDDDAVRTTLVTLKGVGPWTADIYLLMALGRPDVWPHQDLALASALREVKRLNDLPHRERQLEISEAWRPWRAVAARILWHHYLSTRGASTRARSAE